jgi:hypothetical protein
MLAIAGVLETPDEVFARPGFAERAVSVGAPLLGETRPGPTRAELAKIMRAAA